MTEYMSRATWHSTVAPIRCSAGVRTGLGMVACTTSQVPLTSRKTPGRECAHGERAAEVVVAAEDDRRPFPQARGLRGRARHLAQERAAGRGVAHEAAVDPGEAEDLLRPAAGRLVKEEGAGGHGVVGCLPSAEHEVEEIFYEEPLRGPRQDCRLVLGHPQEPQRRAETPQVVAADGEGLLRPDVSSPTTGAAARCADRAS